LLLVWKWDLQTKKGPNKVKTCRCKWAFPFAHLHPNKQSLNGKSFLLWEKYVQLFLGAKEKLLMVIARKLSFSDAKSPYIAEK